MKVMHRACSCSLKQINKGMIKVFDTPLYKGISNQVDNKSDMKLQFNLNAFNACCIQVHKAKYSMNMQYTILRILEMVWAPYHTFRQLEGYCIALIKFKGMQYLHWATL
jgi:hypothetical protein